MCVVSMVIDHYRENSWPGRPPSWPWSDPMPRPDPMPSPMPNREVAELRREVEELKDLIRKAKDIDAATGQPDCEMDEKVEFVKQIADYLGVDLEDVFDPA